MKKAFIVLGVALLASGVAFAASDSTLKQNPNTGPAAPGWVLPEETIPSPPEPAMSITMS